MRRIGTALCVVAILAALGTSAFAGNFRLSISIGVPVYRPPVVCQAPVVVYQPTPVVVYQQAPVVYQPVVYQPAPVVYQPVVLTTPRAVMYPPRPRIVQQPIIVNPPPVVIQQPVYRPVYAPARSGIRFSLGSSSGFRHGRYNYEPVTRANGSVSYRRVWCNN